MPTAINPETGEFLVLGGDGQWAKPTIAKNPETGESLYLDGSEWKPAPYQASLGGKDRQIDQIRNSPFSRATDALVQGATLGFADEVGAAGNAVGAFAKNLFTQGPSKAAEIAGQRYDESLGRERGRVEQFAEQRPVANAALQVGGGMAAAPAMIAKGAGIMGAAPTLGQISMQAAKGAAVPGAIAGFGSGEGGFVDRAQNAAIAGILSAGVGAATPGIVQGSGQLAQIVKNTIGKTNADETAQRLILRAMERDGLGIDDAVTSYNAGQLTGAKPEALIDIGGENVRGLMRGAAATPGPAKNMAQDFVQSRQAGQGERIADDIGSAISRGRLYQSADDLTASRSANAGPLYDEAFKANLQVDTPAINRILETPAGRRALRDAGLIMQNDRTLLSQADPELTAALREAVELGKMSPDEITGFGVGRGFKLRTLDYVKQTLWDQAEAAKVNGKETGASRAIKGLWRDLVKELDAADVTAKAGSNSLKPEGGAYARARKAYSGPSQSLEAIDLGRSIFKQDSELTAKAISELSDGDREFFKVGVVRALKDQADNVRDRNDLSKRIAATPGAREKLRAAFDSDADFNGFMAILKREGRMYDNAQQINPRANSRTGVLEEEIADVRKSPVVQFATDLRQGIIPAVGNAAGRLYDRGRGINHDTSQVLAKVLLETNPDLVRQAFSGISARKQTDTALAKEIARQLGLVGQIEGRAIGNLSN